MEVNFSQSNFYDNTKRSTALIKSLREIEIRHSSLEYEVGVLLSLDGEIIKEWVGTEDEISIPIEDFKNKDLWNGNIFTHNHTRGLHFSPDDIDIFINVPLLEIRASTPFNMYFSISKKKGLNLKLYDEMLKDKVGSFSKGMEIAVEQGINFNTKDFINKLYNFRIDHADNWFKNNADKYNYIYEKGAYKNDNI